MSLKKKVITGLLTVFLLGLGANYAVKEMPNLHRVKRKVAPFLNIQSQYNNINSVEETAISPFEKPQMKDNRGALEDQISQLIFSKSGNRSNIVAGGYILSKNETREGHLFGKYSSYDAQKTQDAIEDIVSLAQEKEQRTLIIDEGEGGYVPRTGTLAPAEDIGAYYENNIINPTLEGKVRESRSKTVRKKEAKKLFDEYAQELSDRGIDVVLGPIVDVVFLQNEDNYIRRSGRCFSDKHIITREIAQLYIDAMHEQGIKVVAKHFLTAGLSDEGDVHEEEVINSRNVKHRLWAGETYRVLKDDLDAIMVSHYGNPSDEGRPYSVSKRAYCYLKQDQYKGNCAKQPFIDNRKDPRSYNGIGFDGFIIVDDLSMKGLLNYIANEELNKRGERLVAGCDTPEAKAAVLAIDQGAHAVISLKGDTDAIVAGIAQAYNVDDIFRQKVDKAITAYKRFVE